MDDRDLAAYLGRLGVARPVHPTAEALHVLHRVHNLTVPFENLDIHRGVPISLDVADIADKVLRRGRGGFCYELNALFADLLGSLGYRVRLVSAFELDMSDGGPPVRGAEFDHLRLLVAVPGADLDWIADVGNCGGWLDPLPAVPGRYGRVEVHRDDDLWWLSAPRGGSRSPEWAWTTIPRTLAEFTDRCRYQEQHPDSHFVARRLAVLPTERGRISLVNGVLAETVDDVRTERTLTVEQEHEVLANRFGIVIEGT